ncbi:unnamed protein product [Closterium sp. NIES-64]|nr:unnamed protein product [Closterium sp. NIES-64]
MAEIPQFDEDMELTDEMLEAMEMPDEPAGSNFPRTRSPTDAPAPKKPCVAADSSIPPPHETTAATSEVTEEPADTPTMPAVQTASTTAPSATDSTTAPSDAVPVHPAPPATSPSSSPPPVPCATAETTAPMSPQMDQTPEPELPHSHHQAAHPPPPCSNPSRHIFVKPYVDPQPDFTKAKANGAPVLSLRKVPTRFEESDLLAYLVPECLAGIAHFHRMKDPYDGVFLPIMTGIPTPLPDDPDFLNIPALIPSGGGAFGACAASNAFRADPGLLFIGTDLDIEPWTCVSCNFECGPTLDSALKHMESAQHRAQLLANAHNTAAKETYLTWSFAALLKKGGIEAFLKKLKITTRA